MAGAKSRRQLAPMKPIAQHRFADPAFVDRADEPDLVAALVRPHFIETAERLLVLAFDELSRLVGLVENSGQHPRCAMLTPDMVRRSLSLAAATHLMLVHNHPSGDASPSARDHELTRRFAAAATLAGLAVSDHLILTEAGHFSFRAAGLL
jgi:DNA repair protein RadC